MRDEVYPRLNAEQDFHSPTIPSMRTLATLILNTIKSPVIERGSKTPRLNLARDS